LRTDFASRSVLHAHACTTCITCSWIYNLHHISYATYLGNVMWMSAVHQLIAGDQVSRLVACAVWMNSLAVVEGYHVAAISERTPASTFAGTMEMSSEKSDWSLAGGTASRHSAGISEPCLGVLALALAAV
jgi:hypothetical protein